MQGEITFYKDSNILIYRSNIGVKMDGDSHASRSFCTPLPKGLLAYQFSNGETFIFYYKNEQVISISIDLAPTKSKIDTTYEPNEAEINKYLSHFIADSKKTFNILNIGYKSGRKQLVLKKDAATILLYNIKNKNLHQFISQVTHFEFL